MKRETDFGYFKHNSSEAMLTSNGENQTSAKKYIFVTRRPSLPCNKNFELNGHQTKRKKKEKRGKKGEEIQLLDFSHTMSFNRKAYIKLIDLDKNTKMISITSRPNTAKKEKVKKLQLNQR